MTSSLRRYLTFGDQTRRGSRAFLRRLHPHVDSQRVLTTTKLLILHYTPRARGPCRGGQLVPTKASHSATVQSLMVCGSPPIAPGGPDGANVEIPIPRPITKKDWGLAGAGTRFAGRRRVGWSRDVVGPLLRQLRIPACRYWSFSTMVVVGMELTIDDFRRVASQPATVMAATVGQFILLPVIG